MIEWIKKHLDPPGNERKNRRSIFSFIGRVFGIVKDDAVKAHNAFFPYLCDADKLRRHGKSLMIPELPFDTEKNYRDRVATASFYLMRAGERAYIHEQLRAYLGNRYEISDEFLEVYLKTSELSTEERIWAYGFLDGILDPNISFSIAEWFNFHGEVFGGVFPKINNIFHVPAFEDQAAAHTALSPSITKQYFVPAGENDAQSFLTLLPKLDCIINILSEEVII